MLHSQFYNKRDIHETKVCIYENNLYRRVAACMHMSRQNSNLIFCDFQIVFQDFFITLVSHMGVVAL